MKETKVAGLLTISEAAERMHVSRQTIYTWIHRGKLKPVLTLGGRTRVPENQLTIKKGINIPIATMDKNNAIQLSAFVLLITGTIGLLVNEFVADWGRSATITFACLNVSGLVVLAYTTWTMGKRKAE